MDEIKIVDRRKSSPDYKPPEQPAPAAVSAKPNVLIFRAISCDPGQAYDEVKVKAIFEQLDKLPFGDDTLSIIDWFTSYVGGKAKTAEHYNVMTPGGFISWIRNFAIPQLMDGLPNQTRANRESRRSWIKVLTNVDKQLIDAGVQAVNPPLEGGEGDNNV